MAKIEREAEKGMAAEAPEAKVVNAAEATKVARKDATRARAKLAANILEEAKAKPGAAGAKALARAIAGPMKPSPNHSDGCL
jgi:hypothetical protein